MTISRPRAGEQPVTLSSLEYDVLLEHLGIESVPLVLKVDSPGRTTFQRAELAESAWASLAARDLGKPTDLEPELESMIRLIAAAQREVDARLWLGRSVRVLVASTGSSESDRAVMAVKDGDTLSLRPAAATGLAREAATVLPPMPPGPGRSVTVRSADLDAAAAMAGDDVARFQAALHRHGVRTDDAETLAGMVQQVELRGQFGAAARDRQGRRVRAAHVVGFFDSQHGRYAQLRRESPSGEEWSTIAPVDRRTLISHIDELLSEVPAQRE